MCLCIRAYKCIWCQFLMIGNVDCICVNNCICTCICICICICICTCNRLLLLSSSRSTTAAITTTTAVAILLGHPRQEVSTIPSPPGLRSATQKKLPGPQSQRLLSHCLFMSPGGNVQCAMKLGSAVLPWTPCRVHCFFGNTVNCVLETGMAGPPAAGLNLSLIHI